MGAVAVLYLKDFPEELHRELRIEAAMAGIPQRQLVIEAVVAELARRQFERDQEAAEAGRRERDKRRRG